MPLHYQFNGPLGTGGSYAKGSIFNGFCAIKACLLAALAFFSFSLSWSGRWIFICALRLLTLENTLKWATEKLKSWLGNGPLGDGVSWIKSLESLGAGFWDSHTFMLPNLASSTFFYPFSIFKIPLFSWVSCTVQCFPPEGGGDTLGIRQPKQTLPSEIWQTTLAQGQDLRCLS